MSRASLTADWIEEYRNVPGGPWLGRDTMQAAKDARVNDIETQLAVMHAADGHGPYVINYHVGTGSVNAVDQKLSEARQLEARRRRCVCGDEFTNESGEDIFDGTTYDGYTRDLREVDWQGHVWKGQQYPVQPRDPDARRGRVFLVHGDDA